MSSSSSTALTRIETVPSTSPIATMLRQILAWMDSRNTVVVTLPAPVETPIAEVEEDDGILKPKDIADKIAALIWAHRDSVEVTMDYDDADPVKSRHSEYEPETFLRLPGDIRVKLHRYHYGPVVVTAPDGRGQEIAHPLNGVILRAWQALQALAIMETLGIHDLVPLDIEDDGGRPSPTLCERLAQAIGTYVERRVPTHCTETYAKRHYPSNGEPWDEIMPSPWQEIGEGVLLRIHMEEHYNSASTPRVWIMHPVMGKIELPAEAIHKGMERRTSASLAAALGMALELPAHLPMPRGNAQAARVLRLCREAVAAEPDLVDSAGTPIRPLVDRHLPELMKRHAAAAAIAPADQLAAIDADLAEGIERVRLAVEDALSCSAVARRSALKAQLGFLALRHPDPVPLLQSLPQEPAA